MPNPVYPSILPCFEATPYTYKQINTIQSTQFQSGRTRRRRRFADVPVLFSLASKMSTAQLGVWEAWRYHTLQDVGWFDVDLLTGNGKQTWTVRLMQADQEPERLGGDLWGVKYVAEAQQQRYMPVDDLAQYIEAGHIVFGLLAQREADRINASLGLYYTGYTQ